MDQATLKKDREDGEQMRRGNESDALRKNLGSYCEKFYLDLVPDKFPVGTRLIESDGVLTFEDPLSFTRTDNISDRAHLEQTIRSWVIGKICAMVEIRKKEDNKIGRLLRARLDNADAKGWQIAIMHENDRRELRRKYWFKFNLPKQRVFALPKP